MEKVEGNEGQSGINPHSNPSESEMRSRREKERGSGIVVSVEPLFPIPLFDPKEMENSPYPHARRLRLFGLAIIVTYSPLILISLCICCSPFAHRAVSAFLFLHTPVIRGENPSCRVFGVVLKDRPTGKTESITGSRLTEKRERWRRKRNIKVARGDERERGWVISEGQKESLVELCLCWHLMFPHRLSTQGYSSSCIDLIF